MEKQEVNVFDPREEVKKLQEMVRKLELQNEELRIHKNKNGILINNSDQNNFKLISKDSEINSSNDSLLDIFNNDELTDEQTWLYRSSRHTDMEPINLELWLENELKHAGVPSIDAELRNNITRRLTQVKKSFDQRQVDTRTFTRPKKRLQLLQQEELQSEFYREEDTTGAGPVEIQMCGSDEENTVPNGSALSLRSRPSSREPSLPRYTGSPKPPHNLDGTYRLERSVTPDRQSAGGRSTGLPMPRSRLEKSFGFRTGSCSPLNRTFNLDGVHRPDGLDDDQMSSASDSSFSSSHRAALTAGEVKNLARMQEESLRYSSTPWKSKIEGNHAVHQMSSDLPSPITRSSEDFHSDHSEGRSSRSSAVGDSLHSSPTGSPFGSSQAIMGVSRQTDGMLGSNEALDRPLIQARNIPNKQRVESGARGLVRPKYTSRQTLDPNSCSGPSGANLKPQCLVRPSVVQKNGPTTSSGIPRPRASRIPAPKSRAPVPKTDWMDGCY